MNQPKAPAVRASGPAQPRTDPPRSVVMAVRLMYAGAAITAIGVVISIIAVLTGQDSLRASHPNATVAQLHATQNALIAVAVISGLLEIGAWIFMARLNRAGLKWARIVATVLLGLGTLNLILRLTSGGGVSNLLYTVVTWLAGAGAVYFLWQRESNDYFT
ncbi:MAG TPA: hypothetical protein VF506_11685 [Streptosporangiaceae bacterium]